MQVNQDAPAASDEARQLFAEQVNLLYTHASVGMVATVVNSVILAFVLWKVTSHAVLILWLVCIFLVTSARYVLVRTYGKTPREHLDPHTWYNRFTTGVACSGVIWGSAGVFLFPADSVAHQIFMVFVLGGMVAGAVGVFSVMRRTFLAYSLPTILPINVQFFIQGNGIHIAMGFMILFFAILMISASGRVRAATVSSLKLGFEKTGLIERLAERKNRLDGLNAELMHEIAQRRQAQEALEESHQELERRVMERTSELSRANEELAREIEERKHAEEAHRKAEERYRLVSENIPVVVYSALPDTLFTHFFVTGRIEELTGYAGEEFVANPEFFHRMLHPDDRESVWETMTEQWRKRSLLDLEYRIITKDYVMKWVKDKATAVLNDSGEIIRMDGVMEDITDQKSLEEQLRQAHRMEAIGTLAGGIAHDYNNLLSMIMGNISMAKDEVKPEDGMYRFLEEAEEASHRAKDLTHRLITFAEGGLARETAPIAALLENYTDLALSGSNVDCAFFISEDLWPVNHDKGQMGYVISHLVGNAVEAMPRGGTISIHAKNITVSEAGDGLGMLLNAGTYVEITVKDEGVGIPDEYVSRIFDPYFSTKEKGIEKGMGLGLATVYAIVHKHDGHICVESEIDVGTTFRIYLPAARANGEEKTDQSKAAIKDRQVSWKILVMDDEEMLRNLTKQMLSRLGHKAELAKDGSEAIALYTKALHSGEPFDAVILDITVRGGMGGKEAVKELRGIDPQVKAIATTGYSEDPIMTDWQRFGFHSVISKPYVKRDLREGLGNVLGGEED